jgi:hypothetical protein
VLGRDVGVRTSVDVLNAQQQVTAGPAANLQQARYAFLMNNLRLKAAAGQLGEADIAEVNRVPGALSLAFSHAIRPGRWRRGERRRRPGRSRPSVSAWFAGGSAPRQSPAASCASRTRIAPPASMALCGLSKL